ncbi:MAG: hypothetical protein U0M12_01920 [Acutalibacteraceae bacterium]|nr:hypothetical protein [Acutalibacteraceae bacterium]
MLKRVKQDSILFTVGGITYGFIEVLWRHHTHWTMIVTGGICFLTLFRIFCKFENIKTIYKCFIGSGVITTIELIVGCIVNLQLKMNVWDYSSIPLNLWGQICPIYSILWGILTLPILFVCKRMQRFFKIESKNS